MTKIRKKGEGNPKYWPGKILLEKYIKPSGISQNRLAREIGLEAYHLYSIVHGIYGITPTIAKNLAKYFNTDSEYWLDMQAYYELELILFKFPNLKKYVCAYPKCGGIE
jgi:addiction module HigA family antidote